jgi:hypothetical protein
LRRAGVGILFVEEEDPSGFVRVTVKALIEGGSAEKTGMVKAGDMVVRVGNQDVSTLPCLAERPCARALQVDCLLPTARHPGDRQAALGAADDDPRPDRIVLPPRLPARRRRAQLERGAGEEHVLRRAAPPPADQEREAQAGLLGLAVSDPFRRRLL